MPKRNKKTNIAIEIKNVSKTFNIPKEQKSQLKQYFTNPFHRPEYVKFDAVKNISFDVKKGEFLGIIGRNGSGKSTMLKMLAGVYQPSEGTVKVKGSITPFLELGVGFNPELSARENIFLNGTILGMTRKHLLRKFNEIVDFAEIQEFIDMPVKNFSSGMQVRLAFAIVIQSDADVYLVDEVLAVGDANFQEKCFDVFWEFKELGKTVVYVSHSLDTINTFCDRTALISKGELLNIGNTQSVLEKYNDLSNKSFQEYVKTKEKKEKVQEKNPPMQIIKVSITDLKGNNKKLFRRGEKINITIEMKANANVKDPICGITITNAEGRDIIVTNSEWENIPTGNIKKGTICTITYQFINHLANDKFYISPAIASSDKRMMYDNQSKINNFRVRDSIHSGGIIDLPYNITFETT